MSARMRPAPALAVPPVRRDGAAPLTGDGVIVLEAWRERGFRGCHDCQPVATATPGGRYALSWWHCWRHGCRQVTAGGRACRNPAPAGRCRAHAGQPPAGAPAPAEILARWLADHDLGMADLAARAAAAGSFAAALPCLHDVRARRPLAARHAAVLAAGTGVPAWFWLALESDWRKAPR